MPKTVLFDLDGTLIDPMIGITRSIQFSLEKFPVKVPPAEDLTWCIGPPLLESFQKLLDNERAPAAVAFYRERFGVTGLFENTLYPRIHELLSGLKATKTKLYVASSKPEIYVRQILDHFDLTQYFDEIFGSELDGTRADKTELLQFAIAEAKIETTEATMIGDRKHDILGARNNNIGAIGVLYGYGSREELHQAGANQLAESTDDLASLLL